MFEITLDAITSPKTDISFPETHVVASFSRIANTRHTRLFKPILSMIAGIQCHKVRANWHPECKHGLELGGTEFLRKCLHFMALAHGSKSQSGKALSKGKKNRYPFDRNHSGSIHEFRNDL